MLLKRFRVIRDDKVPVRAQGGGVGERDYGSGHPKSEITKMKCCSLMIFLL